MEASAENYNKYQLVAAEINEKFAMIKKDTAMFSTHSHIFQHRQFQELVAYGDKIVPYIIHKILEYGGDWVYFRLLQQITKAAPVPKEHIGKFIYNQIYWLTWYVESDYYENEDIYHGLVN